MPFTRRHGIVVGLLLTAASACVHGAPGVSSVGTPESGPRCVIAVTTDTVSVKVTDGSRKACLPLARLIEPGVPTMSDARLRAGPPNEFPLGADADVHCRLHPRPRSGGSLKFRCMRTNHLNQLYDDAGELVPAAASVDAGGALLDAQREKVLDEDGKPRQGDELRVKYFLGPEPPMRYREMFTETVVSRLFWVLGIPVDRVYMPASVRCLGCSADPFGQKAPTQSPTPQIFTLASVERPYDGKNIAVTRSRLPLGFGGDYDHGFSFEEIGKTLSVLPRSRRAEAEIMAVALNLVGYNNTHSYQNDMVCRKGGWDKVTGECTDVVAYVADVGGTLGGKTAWWVKGMPKPEMKQHPRGDFVTYSHGSVFTDRAACRLRYPIGAVRTVSEAARLMLDQRIRGRIGREQLRIIFEAASIHRMESRVNATVSESLALPPGADLDRAVQLRWADELMLRFDEILTTRCPD